MISETASIEAELQTIDDRFKMWVEYSPKKDYLFIQRVNTTSRKELIKCIFPDKQRHQVIRLEDIQEIFEWLQEDLESGTSNFLIKKHQLTLSDLSEWKAELIRLNFGSCVMDW